LGAAQSEFDRDIASVEHGRTDLGGSLLGAFNVHFIVLERTQGASRWLAQRDLAVTRSEPRFLLLENQSFAERAALYPELPPFVTISHSASSLRAVGTAPVPEVTANQVSSSRYSAPDAHGPGVVFVAEAHDPRWSARVGGTALSRTAGGWGNAFRVPPSASGKLEIGVPRSLNQLMWVLVILLAWIVAAGAAFSRRRGPHRSSRGSAG
jgi:hypothetical protein